MWRIRREAASRSEHPWSGSSQVGSTGGKVIDGGGGAARGALRAPQPRIERPRALSDREEGGGKREIRRLEKAV